MATSWTMKTLSLTLLMLAALQGCSGEDRDSPNQDALVAPMKAISKVLQCFRNTMREELRILKDLRSLPDMMLQVKEQVHQLNEKSESVERDNTLSDRVDALTQEITQLKVQLENQNQTVQDQDRRLRESERREQELEKEIEKLKHKVEISKKQAVCVVSEQVAQHLPDIKEVVQAFSQNGDWGALRRGLQPFLDDSHEEYRQLQQSRTVYEVGVNGHTELAALLLCAGMPVDKATSHGDNMLHGAAAGGHLQLVKLLLDRGADVSAKSNWGSTPVINAAYKGHMEVAQWLVQAGADTTARDNGGSGALDWARYFNFTALAQYLEQLPH